MHLLLEVMLELKFSSSYSTDLSTVTGVCSRITLNSLFTCHLQLRFLA